LGITARELLVFYYCDYTDYCSTATNSGTSITTTVIVLVVSNIVIIKLN